MNWEAMNWEVYTYDCDDCERTIRLASPEEPEWCPWCGVRL